MLTIEDQIKREEPAKPCKAPRVSIKKPRQGQYKPTRLSFWIEPESARSLNKIKLSYNRLVGRQVSLSVVVRRALALLAARLDAIEEIGGAAGETEVAAVLRCVR